MRESPRLPFLHGFYYKRIFHGNYLAALAATVSTFVIGFVWYHPKVFGNEWMRGVGLTEERLKASNFGATMGANAVVTFLSALALTLLVGSAASPIDGLKTGLFIGIFYAATTHVMHTLYELRSPRVIMIGAGHDIVHYAVMGLVMGLF